LVAGGKLMRKSVVGELVGRRGIVYAPTNRAGVLLIFGRLLEEFDFLIEETAADCSYVVIRRRHNNGRSGESLWERAVLAIAYRSAELKDAVASERPDSSFDFLICWQNDWPECPYETFELGSLFARPEKEQAIADGRTIEELISGDADAALRNRAQLQRRFEKAIGELNIRIGKLGDKGN